MKVWALGALDTGCGLGWLKSSHKVRSCVDSSVRSEWIQELGLRGCGGSALHLRVDDTGILGERTHR